MKQSQVILKVQLKPKYPTLFHLHCLIISQQSISTYFIYFSFINSYHKKFILKFKKFHTHWQPSGWLSANSPTTTVKPFCWISQSALPTFLPILIHHKSILNISSQYQILKTERPYHRYFSIRRTCESRKLHFLPSHY